MNVKLSEKGMIPFKVILPLLLIFFQILLILYIYWGLVDQFVKEYDGNNLELARSIDQNITTHLERCRNNMAYGMMRGGFANAEKEWIDHGSTDDLLQYMSESLMARDKLTSVLLAEQDGEIFLSTDGNLNYTLLYNTSRKDVAYYTTADNRIFMGMILEKNNGLRYIALLNPEILYQDTIVNEIDDGGHILFTDENNKIILSSHENQVQMLNLDENQGTHYLGVDFLKECQNKQKIGTTSFIHEHTDDDVSFKARMVVLPTSQGKNGIVAIAVLGNFDRIVLPLNQSVSRMLVCTGIIIISVLVLVYYLQISGLRHKKELELLRQKNEAMKELNRQTAELAHHQRLELVGTLTAGVAHEFNNLLTPIMGYSIMALENIPEENIKATDQILQIYESSRKAKEITRRLSDISRKNNRKLMTCLNVESLLQKTLEMAQPSCPPFVEVVCEHPEKEIHVFGDETQLIQMFLNLVINAFHAMIPHGGTLSIGIEESDGNAKITVKDTGCGIAADMIPSIFNPFFTTKENGAGTGLGLAIVQQVISEHHGEIKVESEPDVGSSFIVFLPLHEAELRTGEDLAASHDENEV